jgi:hypothetical protein
MYVEGWVEGCLERIGEDNPDEEQSFRDFWDDETQQEVEMESSRRTARSGGGGLRGFEG